MAPWKEYWLLGACAVVLMTQLPVVCGCGRGAVYIQDNQYRQLVIAISDNVPEDLRLLDRIKEVFTETSQRLFQTTRYRAYFGQIMVLVPKTWRPNATLYQPITNETFDTSDVTIDLLDQTLDEPHRPFTIKTTPCGEPGSRIVMTPEYFINASIAAQYGPQDKVLVHEWGHLRYGLFDEYPTGSDAIHFYASSSGGYEATRCSTALTGTMYNVVFGDECASVNGQPEADCRFKDDELPGNQYGSLMYRQYLDHITEFCDNDPTRPETYHNSEAPNEQNRMCGGRSVWEVLRSHGDFLGENNPALAVEEFREPEFKYVKSDIKRTVLVLDVSGSMKSRILRLNQGCSNFIKSIVHDGEKIGLVIFSTTAYTISGMTVITDTTRDVLVDMLPNGVGGGTGIGSGILEGIDVLSTDGGTAGANMIIVSDGGENEDPRIADVRDEVIASGITVHTIAFTNAGESSLDPLARSTGGMAFLYPESASSNSLNEAFEKIGSLNQNALEQSYTLASTGLVLVEAETYTSSVLVDSTLGWDTEFLFNYASGVTISLTDPNNVRYTEAGSQECAQDADIQSIRCLFPGISTVGRWEYSVTSTATSSQLLTITVISRPSSSTDYPIIAQVFWALPEMSFNVLSGAETQRLYASVSKGYMAVLGADVTAEVELPTGGSVNLTLLDNGAGPDLTKDDGIYSSYFTHITGNGRYNVKVTVNSSPTTVISPQHIVGVGAARQSTGRQQRSTATPSGSFQRTASGGAFSITNYTAPASGKFYPPGQILDVHVTGVSRSNGIVSLGWTATGAELDSGIASGYEIRMGRSYNLSEGADFVHIMQNDVTQGNLSAPHTSGEVEQFDIIIPNSDGGTYFFAVLAYDTDGRNVSSPLSNVVSATLTAWDPHPEPNGSHPSPQPSVANHGTNRDLIIGAVVGVLALMILIIVLVVIMLRNRRGRNYDIATKMKFDDRTTSEKMETIRVELGRDNLSYVVSR